MLLGNNLAGFAAGGGVFVAYEEVVTNTTAHTIAVPTGATVAKIECYGKGGTGQGDGPRDTRGGGAGGGYARRDAQSLAGITALHVTVAGTFGDTVVRANDGTGTILAQANSGSAGAHNGVASGGAGVVGDLLRTGGSTNSTTGGRTSGGGCAGPDANGGSTSGSTAGTSGGGLAGAGNQLYGGGGTSNQFVDAGEDIPGLQGVVKITWS